MQLGVGSDEVAPTLLIRRSRDHDHIGTGDEWARLSGQHRAVAKVAVWAWAGNELEAGRSW
jgi:hypothetical protein